MAANRWTIVGVVALPAIALLALAASACGGGDGAGGGETPGAGETPQADGAGNGEGALQELGEFAGRAADGTAAKVTYKVTTEVDGQTFEGEWVLTQRPPDFRFEITGTDGGEDLRTIVINTGGKSYLCTSGGGQDACLQTDAGGTEAQAAAFAPLFDVPQEVTEQVESVSSVQKSQRTIAGVDATCFSVESALADLSKGEMCFSEEGILLLLQAPGSSFEATSVSTDITDADFEPPFDIFELPDFEAPTP